MSQARRCSNRVWLPRRRQRVPLGSEREFFMGVAPYLTASRERKPPLRTTRMSTGAPMSARMTPLGSS